MDKFGKHSPEYLLILAVLIVMFVLMGIASLCRFLGIDFLVADVVIYAPSEMIKLLAELVLLLFECCILVKLFCRKSWLITISIALIWAVSTTLIPRGFDGFYDVLFMVTIILVWREDRGRALLQALMVMIVVSLYGLLVSYGRIEVLPPPKYDLNLVLAVAVDYKILFIVLYLQDKLRRCDKNVLRD